MTPALRHFTVADGLEPVKTALASDGACILDNFISESLCDNLMQDFMAPINGVGWCNTGAPDDDDFKGLDNDEFFGLKTKRFHGLPGLSLHSEQIIRHPFLLSLARDALGAGKRCRDIRVSTMELMVLGHGEVQQTFHRDFDSWPFFQGNDEDTWLISANVALCDFTESNGATVVVPGSHRWTPGRLPEPGETCQALMTKGSALIYSGHVVHGGGSNRETAIRTGFYIGYIPSWLSGLENHAVSTPEAVLEALDPETRRLLGIVPGGWIVIP